MSWRIYGMLLIDKMIFQILKPLMIKHNEIKFSEIILLSCFTIIIIMTQRFTNNQFMNTILDISVPNFINQVYISRHQKTPNQIKLLKNLSFTILLSNKIYLVILVQYQTQNQFEI
ncbi:hypothetical protein TTHERM_001028812 (macronuclear) [Tetrahymena thermophila SB210]|uniref:Uncharacterized protein n=1 Tax=Tetrahymena thermophila (strain SB210) TaxID=312017 RepID=W7XD66_TETTS|nr:hypothetical protein TTHERM_001028812 [Tetrahymena thermophila SB210]EWS74563.1 hypothetical protein TTHERM_001028812 [Tetrahymena thermophila SB210]|eukprot:XP_012652895.1 hypothetical protein TTHERM_001028812 [Tetrahymena thermophila SB210]